MRASTTGYAVQSYTTALNHGEVMPYAAPRHCPHHHRLFTGSRCPDCAREAKARADARRPNAGDRGYSSEWRKARAEFLEAHPTCCKCGAPATVVDHVVAHKGDQGLFWARSNWAPMCKPCHDRKTATQDGAFKPRPGGAGSRSSGGAMTGMGGFFPREPN